MVKILAIGDPHFKVNNLPWMRLFEEKVVLLIEEHRPDAVVVLGDTLDRFKLAHLEPQTAAVNFLSRIRKLVKLLVILIGNHDRINNSTFLSPVSPFRACREWENTILCDDAARVIEIDGLAFLGVPYVFPGKFLEAIAQFNPKIGDFKAIFGHQEIRGVKMGAIESEIGDEWPQEYPTLISGHIHEYQRLNGNVIYVGSPRVEDTISLFEFPSGTETRLKLGLPKKIRMKLSVPEYLQLNLSIEPQGEYRISVHGPASELAGVQKLVQTAKLRQYPNVRLTFDPDKVLPVILTGNGIYRDFRNCLNDRLRKQPKLQELYSSLFG